MPETEVISHIRMWSLNDGIRSNIDATFSYNPMDPYAVTVNFLYENGEKGPEWWLSRQLLWDGLRRSVGMGDVQVRPTGEDRLQIILGNRDGRVVLNLERVDLRVFLRETCKAVPLRGESDLAEYELDQCLTDWKWLNGKSH